MAKHFSNIPVQQAMPYQQSCSSNFFAGRAKYPTFKNQLHKQVSTFTDTAFNYVKGKQHMAKCKTLPDLRWSCDLPSVPFSFATSKDTTERYLLSCRCEFEPISLPINTSTVGIDIGLKDLFVTNTGLKQSNPSHTAKYAALLLKLQRRLSQNQNTLPEPA